MKQFLQDYPPHIAEAMFKKKLGIGNLAKMVGVSTPTIRKILLNKPSRFKTFRDPAKKRVADALGLTVVQLGK